ncbi:MAG: nuclear transport factor 2 family protein [Acidobacteriia bacterium]|nr:nuclear transport factor 2 family protein [Terriglobia bacterium]
MTTNTEKNVASAVAYYQAMHNKDLAGMARHLCDDVRFIGPLAEMTGKDAVLETANRFMRLIKGIRVNARMGSGDQIMLTCDLEFPEPIGRCRTAVLMTFEDGLIARIELFYDARPFEKSVSKEVFGSR